MKAALRILMIEDSEDDALLIMNQISKGGYVIEHELIESADQMEEMLKNKYWDIILSDYVMPHFNGLYALTILKESGLDIPFIIISGTIGEEVAVECMKAGANDYIMKDNLKRLVPAIERELNEAKNRAERKRAEESLRENREFLNSIIENIPDMIFVKDAKDLCFVKFNKACENLLGYSREEMIGKNDYDIYPKDMADLLADKDKQVLNNKDMIDVYEEMIQTKDRGERFVHTKKISIPDKNGIPKFLLGISEDITERKKAEKQLQTSLKEKEVLLQELYHRTKNNMQVICSMLQQQLQYTQEEKVRSIFQEMENRIQSMALVQKMLYQFEDLSIINLKEYINKLVNLLIKSYNISKEKIKINLTRIDEVSVLIDCAIPCGLILNELITNSIKHAFPGDRTGELTVSLHQDADKLIELSVSDNGIGVHQDFDFTKSSTMGLKNILLLGEKQLGGKVVFESTHGVSCTIHFKDSSYKRRV